MAIITYSQQANMQFPHVWGPAYYNGYSSSRIGMTDLNSISAVFYGSFIFSQDYLDSGIVTGYDMLYNGNVEYTVRGVSLDAIVVNDYLADSAANALLDYTLTGNDSIIGSAFNDSLLGGIGQDRITGNNGNDTLIGGAGNDTMIGGLGNDVYEVTDDGDVITESLNEGTDTVWSYVANYTMAANVENLYAPGGAARLIGNALNNIISANYGDNVIIGGAGNDTMIGGLGNDVYEVTDDGDVITESLNEGTDTVWSYVANYTMAANVENLYAPGGAARLIGNALNNIISANYGDNVIIGGAGNDTMIGGLGNDVYEVTDDGDVITESLNEGTDTVWSYVANYTMAANVENLYAPGGAARLIGNALNNIISANYGDNVIIGGAGNDTMIGGLGNDVYEVTEVGDVITELANQGGDTAWVYVNNYTLADNVETFYFGAAWLRGTGNALNNTMFGSIGNDVLIGAAGDDTMIGGSGNDTYSVLEAGDVVTELSGQGTDTVFTSVNNYVLASNVENLNVRAVATAGFTFTGNGLDNTIVGNDSDTTLIGGGGNDTISGGGGNDTLTGGNGSDTFVFNTAINSGLQLITDFTSSVDKISLSDAIFPSLYGMTSESFIAGNGLNSASTSNHRLIYNTLNGNLFYDADGVGGTTAVNIATLSGAPNLTLNDFNIVKPTITGTSGNDTLNGDFGSDVIYGGSGSDTLDGKNGRDIYIVASGDEHNAAEFFDTGLSGNDEVRFTSTTPNDTLTLFSGDSGIESIIIGTGTLDNPITSDSTALNINASSLAYSVLIQGNSGDNSIIGTSTNDTLLGGNGNDSIYGGLGNNMLTGGNGTDNFVFNSTVLTSYQTITDFTSGIDKLNLHQSIFTTIDSIDADSFLAGNGVNTAANTTQRLIYNTLSGVLYYDSDGAGGQAAAAIATLSSLPTLTFNDFNLVSAGRVLNGTNGNDTITGDFATDVIIGGLGNDILDGAGGSDIYVITSPSEHATAEFIDSGVNGTDEVRFSSTLNDETLSLFTQDVGIERIVIGTGNERDANTSGTASLNINANAIGHSIELVGNNGNNQLRGSNFADVLTGNRGDDTYYITNGDIVIENANEGIDTVVTSSQNYTLQANIENITYAGTYTNGFTFNGNHQNNTITSNETYMWGPIVMNGEGGDDTLIGIYSYDQRLNGGSGNDNITGGIVSDIIDGGTGDDVMDGGNGDDIYYVDSVGDQVIEAADSVYNIDTVRTTLLSYSHATVENITFIGSGNFTATGNSANNVLTGGIGNDSLSGLDGDDTLDGVSGTDTLFGGNGNDKYLNVTASTVIIENAFEGIDTVYINGGTYTLANNLENLINGSDNNFVGTGNILNNIITGGTQNDTLYGGAGNDTLDGEVGTNLLYGGTGDDTYYLRKNMAAYFQSSHTVIENLNEGIDKIYLSDSDHGTTFQLPDHVENLEYWDDTSFHTGSPTYTLNLIGNALNNAIVNTSIVSGLIIHGNDGNDTIDNSSAYPYGASLYGDAGNDLIKGSIGGDLIYGGSGSDILTGGNNLVGNDTFVWSLSDKGAVNSPDIDTITDYQATNGSNDSLDLRDLLSGESVSLGNIANYIDINVNGSDTQLRVSSSGGFSGGNYNSANEDLRINLAGVNLYIATSTGTEADLIQNMITSNRLLIDV